MERESGQIIRFTYRVLDADKANVLNDKKFEPSLIDPRGVGAKSAGNVAVLVASERRELAVLLA